MKRIMLWFDILLYMTIGWAVVGIVCACLHKFEIGLCCVAGAALTAIAGKVVGGFAMLKIKHEERSR